MGRWVALLLPVALLLGGCQQAAPPELHHSRFLAFGTLVDLTVAGTSKADADKASRAIEQQFAQLHKEWHAWEEGTLEHVNRQLQSGEPFTAPEVVRPLIEQARTLAMTSNHLFNPAIGQLIDLWGFHQDNPEGHRPPSPDAIKALLDAQPRMTDIAMGDNTLQCSNPAVKLDFGAIGKGYGINLAIETLKGLGIESAIVNAGGDLRAIGSRGGSPWKIAIRDPRGEGVLAGLQVSGDESVFTSGDYERGYTYQGKRYHHLIDPRTGYPTEGTASVTVIHPDAALADAAATALFVAGSEQWSEIARAMGIHYVLLVESSGAIHMTPAMQARVELMIKPPAIHLSTPL